MLEIGTVLAAETLLEKTFGILSKLYYWMYPIKDDYKNIEENTRIKYLDSFLSEKEKIKYIMEKEYVPVLIEKEIVNRKNN